MIFICYPKCTTCQKARAWLDEHHITYNFRDIKLENPTYDELAAWHEHRFSVIKASWEKVCSIAITIRFCSSSGGTRIIAFFPSAVPRRGIFTPYEHLLAYLKNVGDIKK